MLMKRLSMGVVATLLATGVAFAQPKPVTPGIAPAPSKTMTTPGTSQSTAKTGSPVNINTATAEQLDALPDVGAARTKAIMAERQKAKFKDWNDFETRMAHTSVNKGVQAKIKDRVTF